MNIAFSYARKSPDEKEDTERSINNQEDLNKTLALGKGWKIKNFFSDKNISGSDRDRKGLKECIDSAKKYKVANPNDNVYILVKDQYRFARDSAFFQDRLKDLDAYGVKVFSVVKNDFLSHDDMGDNVLSLFSQETIKKGRKDALILQEKKIRENLPCIPAPFGYKYNWIKNKNGQKKIINKNFPQEQWIINEKDAKIVVSVVNDYLNKIDYKKTIKELKINSIKYYRIIKNFKKGLYSGICAFVRKYKDSKGKVVRQEEIKYKINCEPIISEEIYNQVRNKPKNPNNG
jgi:DNA invertase Pin-like site-specific DNA recombinase